MLDAGEAEMAMFNPDFEDRRDFLARLFRAMSAARWNQAEH
jgi:hypothetical protein